MKKIDRLLADYSSFHRTRRNLVCHAFGITLIVFGMLALLQLARGRHGLGGAETLILVAFLFYVFLDVRLALLMLAGLGILDLAARAVANWKIGLAAFAAGWVFQAVGHARYGKNSPAFFKNLIHLMVGPVFLVNEVTRIRPVRTE